VAATDDDRRDQLIFVHEPGLDRLDGQVRAGHGEVERGLFLELGDRRGVEGALDRLSSVMNSWDS
jgi:hypothetical protein